MKDVAIVGTGCGAHTLTGEAIKAIQRADVLIGAKSLIDRLDEPNKRVYEAYDKEEIKAFINDSDEKHYAVLVSGDVGFYSAASALSQGIVKATVRFIPGISSLNVLFAKLGMPWQDAALISAHGRAANVVDTVRRNRLTYCLTGQNVGLIGDQLCLAGLESVQVIVGENLGLATEKITRTGVDQLTHASYSSLTTLLFINEHSDDRLLVGLPDERFARLASIPMTKREVRALVISSLKLSPHAIGYDIGAGSGSVTIEMALQAFKGHVYAIERQPEAISLIEKNARAFHVGNVTAINKSAPQGLFDLPAPDAVFIGGSGGQLAKILMSVLEKNGKARVVMTAITLETVNASLSVFSDIGLEPEILQINVARAKKAGSYHMLEANNPIFIISAGGHL